MAAVLKKRALAEYTQTVQVPTAPQPKKFRLTKKATVCATSESPVDAIDRAAPKDRLQCLLSLSQSLPLQDDEAAIVIKKLLDVFQRESESAVKAKILSVLLDITRGSTIPNLQSIAEEVLVLLKKETSQKVVAQGLVTLTAISRLLNPDSKVMAKLMAYAKQNLTNSNYLVKCRCLEMMGSLSTLVDTSSSSSVSQVLAEYTKSQDPRVRTAAFNTMLSLHARGSRLDVSMYEDACSGLTDSYESVRQAALRLVCTLSQSFPEHSVSLPDSQETIRLVDDAFAKVCDAITDLSMDVRVQAARLMGSMEYVSPKFLQQTLDKKIMSNMRRKRTAHERQQELVTTGEWSSGKRWADDAPKEEIDTDALNLMTTGSCGAFIHGLEDEFLEVRSASLDSLCNLAIQHPSFAHQSLDFIIDMFNDEIEEVRLKAIDTLKRISAHIVLRQDQLDEILAALEDFSMDVREALYLMLATCRLDAKDALKMTVDSLLESLTRYPQDRRSIWRCLQKLGANHCHLALTLVPELLRIHPFFDTPEPDVEDPAYTCILILIFNAAPGSPTMLPLLEEHTIRHYRHLRDSMPHLVPQLQLTGSYHAASASPVHSDTSAFLHAILRRSSESQECRGPQRRRQLQETCRRDLERLAGIEPRLSGAARFASTYIQCQMVFDKVLSNRSSLLPSAMSSQQRTTVKNLLEQLMKQSFKLQHLFTGLSNEEEASIRQLRLRVLALQLVSVVRGSTGSALAPCEHFLEHLEQLDRYLSENSLPADAFTSAVLQELQLLDDTKPGHVARILYPLLQSVPVRPLQVRSQIQMASVTVHEPTTDSENALKFTAGLVLGIPLDCEIQNVADPSLVRVLVKSPDQLTQSVLPRLSDFRKVETDDHVTTYRLLTTVLVSHQVWSEACHVEITVGVEPAEREGAIPLCQPIKVYVSPKPIRRGI